MLVSGEYGAVRRLSWSITDWFRTQSYYDSNAWRATWDGEGGGVLMNQCPHQLDLLQWLCGMPVKIRAFCHEGKWHHIEVEDDVTAYMEFMNGATGVFVASTGEAPGINRLEIVTNHAKIVCENNQIFLWETDVSLDSYIKTSADPYQKPSYMCSVVGTDGENAQHTGVINAFAANILRGEPLIADGREGIYMVQLANAIYLSAWTDSTVCIPMNECLFEELLAEKRAQSKPKHVKETFRLSDHRNTGALSP
jgi:predicted dehydrogenase